MARRAEPSAIKQHPTNTLGVDGIHDLAALMADGKVFQCRCCCVRREAFRPDGNTEAGEALKVLARIEGVTGAEMLLDKRLYFGPVGNLPGVTVTVEQHDFTATQALKIQSVSGHTFILAQGGE